MAYEYLFKTPINGRIELETNSWKSIADVVNCASPINPKDLPHFSAWINFNGFAPDHFGKDFAVYMNKWNESVLGLPGNTNVHSILDGVVLYIDKVKVMEGVVNPYDDYLESIVVAHGVSANGSPSIIALYAHANSKVKVGDFVQKGQRIAKLHEDHGGPWNKGRLVHLHLGLANYDGQTLNYENPDFVFGNLMHLTAEPQRETSFSIKETGEHANVRLANFGTLSYQSGPNKRGESPNRLLEYMIDGGTLPKPNDKFGAPKPTYKLIERVRELLS